MNISPTLWAVHVSKRVNFFFQVETFSCWVYDYMYYYVFKAPTKFPKPNFACSSWLIMWTIVANFLHSFDSDVFGKGSNVAIFSSVVTTHDHYYSYWSTTCTTVIRNFNRIFSNSKTCSLIPVISSLDVPLSTWIISMHNYDLKKYIYRSSFSVGFSFEEGK